MKTLNYLLLPFVLIGCANVKENEKTFAERGVARLLVVTQNGSGVGSTSSTVTRVDSQSIYKDAEKAYIEILPGRHVVSFIYRKMTNEGSNARVTVEFFGNSNDIVTPTPAEGLVSLQEIDATGNFEVGKVYMIDVSGLSFVPVNTPSISEFSSFFPTPPSISGARLYELKGDARIVETR